jgi:DUF3108-like
MKYYFLFFVVIILSFTSCKKENSPTEPQSNSDFIPLPLKEQNFWAFNFTTASGGTSEFADTIITTTIINNKTIYVFNYAWLFNKDGFYYSNGILYGLEVNNPSSSTEVVFPKNPSVGQMWTVDGYTLQLVGTNVSVTVPAGTFNCYKILETTLIDSSTSQFYSYWSNGIGFIKGEDKNNVNSKDELINYKVN